MDNFQSRNRFKWILLISLFFLMTLTLSGSFFLFKHGKEISSRIEASELKNNTDSVGQLFSVNGYFEPGNEVQEAALHDFNYAINHSSVNFLSRIVIAKPNNCNISGESCSAVIVQMIDPARNNGFDENISIYLDDGGKILIPLSNHRVKSYIYEDSYHNSLDVGYLNLFGFCGESVVISCSISSTIGQALKPGFNTTLAFQIRVVGAKYAVLK